MKPISRKRQSGLSLIELVVTLVVIAIGFSGIVTIILTISKHTTSPISQWQAIMVSDGVMQYMLSQNCQACYIHEVKAEKLNKIFPDLAKILPDGDKFKISISVKPFINNITDDIVQINVIVHQDYQNIQMTALHKAKGNEHAGKWFYAD